MAETVKVIVRARPLNSRETGMSCKLCVSMDPARGQVSIKNPSEKDAQPKSFTFDGAYFMDSTTEAIYNDIVYPLVENCLQGYNGTVFAYGQTGSGKSFSMQGPEGGPPPQKGIIPRAFEHIFEAMATTENVKYLVHASYLEIYNEEVRDLLAKDIKQKLEIKEHPERGVYVAGLSLHAVHNVNECQQVMERGWKNRSTGATLMNQDSSRSHSIFSVNIEMMEDRSDGEDHIKTAKLNLVDLAGSERQAKTGATGDRLKEATKINLSLSALGNVISALVDGKSTHIPYRDSKLTRLLQDSLGGNTKTMMCACISPADNNYDETLSTLRYANRAKNIKNKPKINEDPKDALLREYQEEIKKLKEMLQNGGSLPAEGGGAVGLSKQEIEKEKQKLREEYEMQMQQLKDEFSTEKKNKAKLEEELTKVKQHYEEELGKVNAAAKAPIAKGGVAPSSSPTSAANGEPIDASQALKKLELLQQQMVGGEQTGNKQLKKKREEKIQQAEKKRQKLAETLSKIDSDDPLMKAYDNMQDKLDATTKQLDKQKKLNKSLEAEIHDLHSEFELDRIDYLDTIRRQDQQLKLYQQITERMQPCMRRDSNYANIEKIKKEAAWDEDLQKWILPEMLFSKVQLPNAGNSGGSQAAGRFANGTTAAMNGYAEDGYQYDDSADDERLRMKLAQGSDVAANYFKTPSSNRVLQNAERDRNRNDTKESYFPGHLKTIDNLIHGVVYTNDIYERPTNNSFNSYGSGNSGNSFGIANGFGSNLNNSGGKKPTRLDALDSLSRTTQAAPLSNKTNKVGQPQNAQQQPLHGSKKTGHHRKHHGDL